MKKVKMPIRHEGSGELLGYVVEDSNIDDILFAIEDEISAELNWWKFMSSDATSDESGLSNLFS